MPSRERGQLEWARDPIPGMTVIGRGAKGTLGIIQVHDVDPVDGTVYGAQRMRHWKGWHLFKWDATRWRAGCGEIVGVKMPEIVLVEPNESGV